MRFFGAEITLLYLRPRSLEEAVQALAESRGTILSGGTDFFPALGDRVPNKPIITGKTHGPDVITVLSDTAPDSLGRLALGKK